MLRSGRLYGENDTKSGTVFVYWKRTNANTMCAMKKLNILIGTLILSAGLAGCSSSYYASSGYANDDLYALHDKTAIARKQQAAAEARKAEAEARRAEWEAKIAEAQALAAENGYYDESGSNPYNDILADTYESAYARRLRGFESPTYRMPSSYYNFRYGSSFTYATAYDPAFYNIIISGDEVWVEPKYITSMFGTWGGTPYGGWYFGWNYSPSWWGYPSYAWGGWNWGFGFTWYDPWWGPGWHPYWGPGWGPGLGRRLAWTSPCGIQAPRLLQQSRRTRQELHSRPEHFGGAVRQRRLCRRFARRPQRLLQHQLRQPQRRQSVQQRLARQQLQQPGQQLQQPRQHL